MSFTTLLAMFLDWLGTGEATEPITIALYPVIDPAG